MNLLKLFDWKTRQRSLLATHARLGLEDLEERWLPAVLNPTFAPLPEINSYVNVGFRLNPVADVTVKIDGKQVTSADAFQAQIDWGNTGWQAAEIAPSSVDSAGVQHFFIKGSHTYTQTGEQFIKVQITAAGATPKNSVTSTCEDFAHDLPDPTALATEPPAASSSKPVKPVLLALNGSGTSANEVTGSSFQLPVGWLSGYYDYQAHNPGDDPSEGDYQLQINWGDGSAWEKGEIDPNSAYKTASTAPMFNLLGTHTYTQPGDYHPVLYVTGPDGQTQTTPIDDVFVRLSASVTKTPESPKAPSLPPLLPANPLLPSGGQTTGTGTGGTPGTPPAPTPPAQPTQPLSATLPYNNNIENGGPTVTDYTQTTTLPTKTLNFQGKATKGGHKTQGGLKAGNFKVDPSAGGPLTGSAAVDHVVKPVAKKKAPAHKAKVDTSSTTPTPHGTFTPGTGKTAPTGGGKTPPLKGNEQTGGNPPGWFNFNEPKSAPIGPPVVLHPRIGKNNNTPNEPGVNWKPFTKIRELKYMQGVEAIAKQYAKTYFNGARPFVTATVNYTVNSDGSITNITVNNVSGDSADEEYWKVDVKAALIQQASNQRLPFPTPNETPKPSQLQSIQRTYTFTLNGNTPDQPGAVINE